MSVAAQQDAFDIFLCYKEEDESGQRTRDSVLAYDIYRELTHDGYRVFFSRVTLEDKAGIAFEPYIFSAISSARVMLVLGTKPEYFQAVWVKNEWSRFLARIQNGENKVLIPLYLDMRPSDLPKELAYLQAQDMSRRCV